MGEQVRKRKEQLKKRIGASNVGSSQVRSSADLLASNQQQQQFGLGHHCIYGGQNSQNLQYSQHHHNHHNSNFTFSPHNQNNSQNVHNFNQYYDMPRSGDNRLNYGNREPNNYAYNSAFHSSSISNKKQFYSRKSNTISEHITRKSNTISEHITR